MYQQTNKYLEALHVLAQQTNSILTTKDIEQVQVLIDKSISLLSQIDKLSFHKLLSSFLKLFLFCPITNSEMFYKKYYALLKDGFATKSKHQITEKYQVLLNCLMQIGQKYFGHIYVEMRSNNTKKKINDYMQNILNINVKGHINLKGYLFLFKKFIQRDKDNSKGVDFLMIIKEAYFRIISDMNQDIKKNTAIDSHSFKLFFINNILEHISTKIQQQSTVYKDYFRGYFNKQFDQNVSLSNKHLTFLLFLMMNKQLGMIKQLIDHHPHNLGNISHELSQNYKSILINILVSGCFLGSINSAIVSHNFDYLISMVIILQRRYFVAYQASTNVINIKGELMNNKIFIEEFLYEHLLKMKRFLNQQNQFKNSYYVILQILMKNNGLIPEQIQLNQQQRAKMFQRQFYQNIMKQKALLTSKAKIYIITIYWLIVTSNQQSRDIILLFQVKLCKEYQSIIQKQSNIKEWQIFFRQFYLNLNFSLFLQKFINLIFGSKLKKSNRLNVFKNIAQVFTSKTGGKVSKNEVEQYLSENECKLDVNQYTIHDLFQLLDTILKSQQEESKDNPELQLAMNNNALSIVIFDKLNIKLNHVAQQEELTFIKTKNYKKSIFIQSIIKNLFKNDSLLKSNKLFMKSLYNTEIITSESVIILVLKKYFNIYHSKINQLVIKKWILNRQFGLIWAMLFCSHKVKSICDQLIKINISLPEYMCFFNLQQNIVAQFIEYLATKDRYKFKWNLANKQLYHLEGLIHCHLPDILS